MLATRKKKFSTKNCENACTVNKSSSYKIFIELFLHISAMLLQIIFVVDSNRNQVTVISHQTEGKREKNNRRRKRISKSSYSINKSLCVTKNLLLLFQVKFSYVFCCPRILYRKGWRRRRKTFI